MTAAWLRVDLLRRWRSLLVLALLVAFAAAAVLTAVAGARRGDSAADRLDAVTLPATVEVRPEDPAFDWNAVRDLPGVEAVALAAPTTWAIDGPGAGGEAFESPADGELLRSVERAVVLDGRLPDPARPDEAVVTPSFVDQHGLGVGDTVTLRLPAAGAVETRIVGVIRSPLLSDSPQQPGRLLPSAGLFAAHPEDFAGPGGVELSGLVRLAPGWTEQAFLTDLAAATGRSDIIVWPHAASMAYVRRIAGIESAALLAFAGAAGLAAVALVGQALARYAAATAADLRVVAALGLTPAQAHRTAAAAPGLAAAAGALLGVVAAGIASRWFPYGFAAYVEPDPGADLDLVVLGSGLVLIPALAVAGALLTARRVWSDAAGAGRAGPARRPGAASRRSAVVALASRYGLPVPVVVGARYALESSRGPAAVPVRPALAGAAVGVLGILAAATFSAAVSDATTNPARYGQVHDLEAPLGVDGAETVPAGDVLAAAAADPDVVAVNDSRVAVAIAAGESVAVFSLDSVAGRFDPVVLEGRLPERGGEIALAPYTAEALGAGPGDRIELAGTRDRRELMVTGLTFLPESEENYYAVGAWVTAAGYDDLFTGYGVRVAHLVLRAGADPVAVADRLSGVLPAAGDGGAAVRQRLERDSSPELLQLQRLPLFLAGFLGVLAVGAVGHALASAVHRRRHDFAVLRAVGMTRPQCRGVVLTQSSVVAVAGLLIGLPLGVALGRTVWRYVADATMVHYVPPDVTLLLLLAVPVTVLVANLLAVWPSQRAVAPRVGPVLRAE
ncbi:ABC transporter permease [Jiangella ureilytica]|uniref:ABC transporter permease n=1 Tax=Jiangella ureilytica TaxID=2530374 RepID=A0A4R4RF49_9ACTN|nr:FtsX-like permease family protein [Jiangella ureilytica]TDC47988.1 ABC transporter permease [Jiangella ureilytica]